MLNIYIFAATLAWLSAYTEKGCIVYKTQVAEVQLRQGLLDDINVTPSFKLLVQISRLVLQTP